MMPVNRSYYSFGVTGYPLGHSLSPRLQEAALHASGLAGEYRLYPIPPLPGGQESLEALLASFRQGKLDGLNVTIPHKQAVIPYLDELTPLAAQIGAVNTIYRRGGSLVGDNTDAPGFMADLLKQFPGASAPQSALLLGAGGATRAVTYALQAAGWRVTIAARRTAAAQEIRDSFTFLNQECEVIGLDALPSYVLSLENLLQKQNSIPEGSCPSPLTLIVNTTPVGMTPNTAHSPWPEDLPFPSRVFIYDLVYNPADTVLVNAARAAGLQAASGLGMLIEQAALGFERWTGIRPSFAAMRQGVMPDVESYE